MKALLLTLVLTAFSCTGLFAGDTMIRINTAALVDKKETPVPVIVLISGATASMKVESSDSAPLLIFPTLSWNGQKIVYSLDVGGLVSSKDPHAVQFSGEAEKGKPVRFRTNINGKDYDITLSFRPIDSTGKEV